MAAKRQIIKKRVGSDGVEIDCEQGSSQYVDIKETKRATYERGRGEHYQKTNYHLCNNSERREYEEPEKITFKNPDDESQTIPYLRTKGPNHGIVKNKWVAAAKGEHYQRTRIHYCNGEDNTRRKVRIQEIEGNGGRLEVERIIHFDNQWGKGAAFQRKRVHLCHTEEQIEQMEGDCKPI